jgi:hypothetical protein
MSQLPRIIFENHVHIVIAAAASSEKEPLADAYTTRPSLLSRIPYFINFHSDVVAY